MKRYALLLAVLTGVIGLLIATPYVMRNRDLKAKRACYDALRPGHHESEAIRFFGQPEQKERLRPSAAKGDLKYDPGVPVYIEVFDSNGLYFCVWVDESGTILRIGEIGYHQSDSFISSLLRW